MNKISVIIPTFKEPDYLDLCISSCIKNASSKDFEIIVVVDGFMEMNKEVLDKWKSIKVLNLGANYGIQTATNYGVARASYENILIVNDDNVFPPNWNENLGNAIDGVIITPNQIEPRPSIFKQYAICNCGTDVETFDEEKFWAECDRVWDENFDNNGSTLPIYMKKKNYMTVGGWDTWYQSPHICDWDFWLKLELAGYEFMRSYKCHFYHFGGKATKNHSDPTNWDEKEQLAAQQFEWKWGFIPAQDEQHRKSPKGKSIRGIRYGE